MAARQMHTKTAYHAEMIISLIRLSEEKENDKKKMMMIMNQ
jgi:hypothetical protein